MKTRECKKCHLNKEMDQFLVYQKNGRKYCRSECHECRKALLRQYHKENRVELREKKKVYIKKREDFFRTYHRNYKRKLYAEKGYKKKLKAYSLVAYHRERLLRKQCENCGLVGVLHLHHSDYNKPLEVVTLCVKCHEGVHHYGLQI